MITTKDGKISFNEDTVKRVVERADRTRLASAMVTGIDAVRRSDFRLLPPSSLTSAELEAVVMTVRNGYVVDDLDRRGMTLTGLQQAAVIEGVATVPAFRRAILLASLDDESSNLSFRRCFTRRLAHGRSSTHASSRSSKRGRRKAGRSREGRSSDEEEQFGGRRKGGKKSRKGRGSKSGSGYSSSSSSDQSSSSGSSSGDESDGGSAAPVQQRVVFSLRKNETLLVLAVKGGGRLMVNVAREGSDDEEGHDSGIFSSLPSAAPPAEQLKPDKNVDNMGGEDGEAEPLLEGGTVYDSSVFALGHEGSMVATGTMVAQTGMRGEAREQPTMQDIPRAQAIATFPGGCRYEFYMEKGPVLHTRESRTEKGILTVEFAVESTFSGSSLTVSGEQPFIADTGKDRERATAKRDRRERGEPSRVEKGGARGERREKARGVEEKHEDRRERSLAGTTPVGRQTLSSSSRADVVAKHKLRSSTLQF
uniref:Uncharacterized protein n=1 Tax=Palpitomonas bilix TaxID=652834 RepID=A0A7S3D6H0_9EUKA